MMLNQFLSSKFKKDVKRLKARHWDMNALRNAMMAIVDEHEIPSNYRDRALSGNWKGYRELHVSPDFLLIYRIEGDTAFFARAGSRSDLFSV